MSDEPTGGKITNQDILDVFNDSPEPFLTSSEIADELPVSRQAVNYRLEDMHEDGIVGKKKTGARSVGWWAEQSTLEDDE